MWVLRAELVCLCSVLVAGRLPPQFDRDWAYWRAEFADVATGEGSAGGAPSTPLPQAVFAPETEEGLRGFLASELQNWSRFSIRSGGRSYEGLSTIPCGLVISTENLNSVQVAADRRSVTLGAGVRHGPAYEALGQSGLAIVGGNCKHVGLTGCALGGCYGHLSRAMGLSVDHLLSLRLVQRDGWAITVNQTGQPELFWALRGAGGGDFGVVTSMTIRTHALPEVVSYRGAWVLRSHTDEQAASFLDEWQKWALSELLVGMSASLECSSALRCTMSGIIPGDGSDAVRANLDSLLSNVPFAPESLEIVTTSWSAAMDSLGACGGGLPAGMVKSSYYAVQVQPASLREAWAVLRAGSDLNSSESTGLSFVRAGHGAAGVVRFAGPSAADLYYANSFMVHMHAHWALGAEEEVRDAHAGWLQRLYAVFEPTSQGSYRNYENLALQRTSAAGVINPRAAPYYEVDSWPRLRQVKADWDPAGAWWHPVSAATVASGQDQRQRCVNDAPLWAPDPAPLEEPSNATPAVVGFWAKDGEFALPLWRLAEMSPHLTHVVYASAHPDTNIGIYIPEDTFQLLRDFSATVADANPQAKRMISIGGGSSNHTMWEVIAGSAELRATFAQAAARILDNYSLDGIDIDWDLPRAEDRDSLAALLRETRVRIGSEKLLTIGVPVAPQAIDEAYAVPEISSEVDLVMLRAYDLYPVEAADSASGGFLWYLTHFNTNLFNANPHLGSASGGVANWISRGAPRDKVVLGITTSGYSMETVGDAPQTWGWLDWPTAGVSSEVIKHTGQPGRVAWLDLHDLLADGASGWEHEEVPELGAAAAWKGSTWVGYESPGSTRQKAAYILAHGLAGGMVQPLHLDAWGDGKESLVVALAEALSPDREADTLQCDWTIVFTDLPMATEQCDWILLFWVVVGVLGFGVLLMLCCVLGELRRMLRVRRLHRQMAVLSAGIEEWRTRGGERPSEQAQFGKPRRLISSFSVLPVKTSVGKASSEKSSSIYDLHTIPEDGADWQSPDIDTKSADPMSDEALLRNLSLVAPTPHPGSGADEENDDDVYAAQDGAVRYSRLLLRDAGAWLDDPENNSLPLHSSKKRGYVKLVFVVTMYAESPSLLERSLRGIAQGIQQLCDDPLLLRSWDEAVVCIVSDGLSKLPEDTAHWFEDKGVFNRELINQASTLHAAVDGANPDVALHCFEGIMRFEGSCPMQTLLVVKEQNAGKLDSQHWAFVGLCERLLPRMPQRLREVDRMPGLPANEDVRALDRFLVTVDAGTEPLFNSIGKLIEPMRYDLNIAGTCGHMTPDLPGCSSGNAVVMSQVFEYELGHVMDKAMESMTGFITVLPGAFSAFRYDCIRRDQWINGAYQRTGPLVSYFKSLVVPETSPAGLNMGLAEDRLLPFALVSMPRQAYTLRYCKKARAVTDVPDTLDSLLKQRRRWNNGAFFARMYVLKHFFRIIVGTRHSLFCRMVFLFQAFIMVCDTVASWFAISLFYMLITFSLDCPYCQMHIFDNIKLAVEIVFAVSIFVQLLAYYNRNIPETMCIHLVITFLYGLLMLGSICLLVYSFTATLDSMAWLPIALVGTPLLCVVIASAVHRKLFQILSTSMAYFMLLPSYSIMFQVFAFCHTHDVSWGTKGIEHARIDKGKDPKKGAVDVVIQLARFRFQVMILFLFSNFAALVAVRRFELQEYLLLPASGVIVFLYITRTYGSLAFGITDTVAKGAKLLLLPHPSREFGEKYRKSREALKALNDADAKFAADVVEKLKRRGSEVLAQKAEQARRDLESLTMPPPPRRSHVAEFVGNLVERTPLSSGWWGRFRRNDQPQEALHREEVV